MNQALINYQKTLNLLKKNTQFQSDMFKATNYLNSPEYKKLLNNNIFKNTSAELAEKLRKAIRVSNNISEISQFNARMLESFKRDLGYNFDFLKTVDDLKNIKIPNIDVVTEVISDNRIIKMGDPKVTSETIIIQDSYVEHSPAERENNDIDRNENIKNKVEYLTTKLFEPLWSAIIKVNEKTLPTTFNHSYFLYLNSNDWYTFFMMISTIQLIIYAATYEYEEKEEKLK
ncbi:TPA: hypothetical protein PQ873_002553 [Staphylococcus aureus]|nr:hypothetical protein [Staphylococcus aureus]